MKSNVPMALVLVLVLLVPGMASAAAFSFTTGSPDGKMATGSRPAAGAKIEIESADDFIVSTCTTSITSATFTGLIVPGSGTPSIDNVVVEVYRVFPKDSNTSRTPTVPTRNNSPSDVDFDTRDSSGGGLTFTTTTLASTFTAANSVLNNITVNAGGEGPVTGTEVRFNVTFTTPFTLTPDHYFFVPQVAVTNGEFYWLSAPKPTTPPFSPDLQSWIRNATLAPDWLRIGTDVIGGATPPTFNASFSLTGTTVPIVITPTNASPLGGVEGTAIATTTFNASGGVAPYSFSETGTLPSGVTLTSAGVLSGTPAEEGSFPITVMATDNGGCTGTIAYTINVSDATLTLTMGSFAFAPGTAFSGPVATFHDANAAAPPSDFTATIDWGDGTTTPGTITSNGGGNFTVSGTHTYATVGPFTVTVVVNDVGGSSARGTATINGATGAPTLSPWMLVLLATVIGFIALRRAGL